MLSAREIEVLEQMARGYRNREITQRLAISLQTLKNHITTILHKLNVHNRTAAVIYALREGWIVLPVDQALKTRTGLEAVCTE